MAAPADTKRALVAVKRARRRRDEAEEKFRASIVAAEEEGASLRAIADAAGVSHPRVHQILALVKKYGATASMP